MTPKNKPTPTPSPSPNVSGGLTPSAEAQAAAATVTTTEGTGRPDRGLTGVPLKTKVVKGVEPRRVTRGAIIGTKPVFAETQYAAGDGARTFATKNNKEKIELLAMLAQIPGLYAKNEAPTEDYLVKLSEGKIVGIRPEDTAALEKVMRFADTVGDDYETAIVTLIENPEVAQGFFDIAGTIEKTKKIRLTPAEALAVEYEQSVRDYLDVAPTKKELNSYAKRINELETKRKGPLTSLERQQILIDSVQEKAKALFGEAGEDSNVMRRGALGGTYNLLKQAYANYGVNVDDKTLAKQSIAALRSKQALENTVSKIKLQAEVSMPALGSYIQQGLTPREALGNYIGEYSKIMGVPKDQVSLDKLAPVWSGDKLMPFQDWRRYIFTLPEYKNTESFQAQKLNDAQALIKNFIG